MDFSTKLLRTWYLSISITLLLANPRAVMSQQLASWLPLDAESGLQVQATAEQGSRLPTESNQKAETTGPVVSAVLPYPAAEILPSKALGTLVKIESTNPQTRTGSLYTLDKDVVITYGNRVIKADHIEYDSDTGEVRASGHLEVSGGNNQEVMRASHGEFNVKTQTGRFYDVTGSVGLGQSGADSAANGKQLSSREIYGNGNPFLFSGRVVIKRGPQEYDVLDGSVTSCQLPKPDWVLNAARFSFDGDKARAKNSVFRLLNVPLVYLPYVTHPVDSRHRQSGLLIPTFGYSGGHKGFVLGEEVYLVLNRSMDLTLGSTYYSERGFAENSTFRYRGLGQNFVTARFSALQDRGYVTAGGLYTNQGGQDVTLKARYDVAPAANAKTRLVADAEYLSSYVYREAFTENFNQAVTTDIVSSLYAVRNVNGASASFHTDRYQGLKPAPQTPAQQAAGATIVNSQVTIFHIPELALATTDHRLGRFITWDLDSSLGGLKRTQPTFTTSGVGRVDLHPGIALPFSVRGLHLRPAFAVRETAYSRSRTTPFVPGTTPVESAGGFARTDLEAQLDLRPPVLERTFNAPLIQRIFGGQVKHTIETEATYRYVTGINNFAGVLRFDEADIVSNTNELEYGVTQRLFLHPAKSRACKSTETPDAASVNGEEDGPDDDPNGNPAPVAQRCTSRELFSWRMAQKFFFDETFGGALLPGRRNILETTLNLSGIAFLTQQRSISPFISRLRLRPSEQLDFEWDFDFDPKQGKFTTSNIFTDVHQGKVFAAFSYAGLSAPGRFDTNGTQQLTTEFNQVRILGGYGTPTKAGLSIAGNAGIDINQASFQYASVETAYNWNCCGFSAEYRKYQLGAVRNEPAYKFNFTLANIGTAGNLRRAQRLF